MNVYSEMNELFSNITDKESLQYIARKTGIFILPSNGAFGKCVDIIFEGKLVDRLYESDEVLFKLFRCEKLNHKNGRVDVFKKYGFNTDKIFTIKRSQMQFVEEQHIGHHRYYMTKKIVLVSESEINKFIVKLFKNGGCN